MLIFNVIANLISMLFSFQISYFEYLNLKITQSYFIFSKVQISYDQITSNYLAVALEFRNSQFSEFRGKHQTLKGAQKVFFYLMKKIPHIYSEYQLE